MNKKDVTLTLTSLGWSISTDDVGDKFALYVLDDRIVQIIYGLDRIKGQQKFAAMLSMTTETFSKAASKISGDSSGFPLVRSWSNIDIRAPEILNEHIRQASENAIAWAKEQDVDKALKEYALLPTDAPGARPIWHLAALALLGDVEKLKFYQASFEAGDRLGFVPYVTKDYIDRAVAFAEKKALGER